MVVQVLYKDLSIYAKKIKDKLCKNTILIISGVMGAGKTTLIQHMYPNYEITSPSYLHAIDYGSLLHIDAYTLKDSNAFLNLNIEDYLNKKTIIVEWGEIFEKEISFFDAKVIKLFLKRENDLLTIEEIN